MIKTIPHWTVLGKTFYNKMDALRELEIHGLGLKDLKFYFFDDEFSQACWTKEPGDEWDLMLRKRAKQLRENYDYLRLWYSGGVDSHTMLNTFLDEDIYIDEIAVHRVSPSGNFQDPSNYEANHAALPFLETKRRELEKTRIHIVDIGPKEYLQFYSLDGWQYTINTFEFRPVTLPALYTMFPELASPHEKGKRLADIRGGDKPRVRRDKTGFYAYYPDSARGENIGAEFIEDFYLTPHYPELHVKQCWLLKKMIEEKWNHVERLEDLYGNDDGFLEDWNGCCRLPLWNNISLGKGSDIYTPKCRITLKEGRQHNYNSYKLYMGSLQEEGRQREERFNQGKVENQLAGILTRQYWMGP